MHVYLKYGFVLFPTEQMKLTRLSSEGVYLYSGCILSHLFGNARGRSWAVFSRNRVRLHGVTSFNIGSIDLGWGIGWRFWSVGFIGSWWRVR